MGGALALAAATVVVYAPVRGHGFVDYDDDEYVFRNPHAAGLTRSQWPGPSRA